MPITINVGLNRKTSQNYNSEGCSINLTAELDHSLLHDPPQLQDQIDRLYAEAEDALDRQTQAAANAPTRTVAPNRPRDNTPNASLTHSTNDTATPAVRVLVRNTRNLAMTILHASLLTAHDLRLLGNNLTPRRHKQPEPNEPLKPARDTPEPAEKQQPPSPAKPQPMELPPAAWQRD